jgi:regulator of PEP synthase PpsR (kinase-PPPase family)
MEEVAARAAGERALVVHTLVDRNLRQLLCTAMVAHKVPAVDMVGDFLEQLSQHLHAEPLGQPGRYRAFRKDYFKRVEAIDFAVKHDDGQRLFELDQAEIVLLGVSRVGKTPLGIYLSLEGWKVANLPLVPGISLPNEVCEINAGRVVGLTIAPAQLVRFRQSRQRSLGVEGGAYVDLQHVIEEVRAANHLFSRHGFIVIDITDKPVEASSEEVVAAVTQRLVAT